MFPISIISQAVSTSEPSIPGPGNSTTKADLLIRAKDAIEAGDQSLHEAADVLALAQEDFKATQREIAETVGKSAAWVNRLLRWRPFGPGSKAGRDRRKCVQSAEQRTPHKVDSDSPDTSTEMGETENVEQGADPKPQAEDVAIIDFTARVLDLIEWTDKRPPEHFSATHIPADDLDKIGKFLTDIANIKKSEAVKPVPIMARPGDVTDSDGQPAVNAEHAAPEASIGGLALHEHV